MQKRPQLCGAPLRPLLVRRIACGCFRRLPRATALAHKPRWRRTKADHAATAPAPGLHERVLARALARKPSKRPPGIVMFPGNDLYGLPRAERKYQLNGRNAERPSEHKHVSEWCRLPESPLQLGDDGSVDRVPELGAPVRQGLSTHLSALPLTWRACPVVGELSTDGRREAPLPFITHPARSLSIRTCSTSTPNPPSSSAHVTPHITHRPVF